jgi:uncharacterized protein (TIGR00290 family)
MTDIPKAVFCWSGGKDSAYCLNKILSEHTYDVRYLLTTVNEQFKRISMHGVREELLEKQAQSVGIDLIKVGVSAGTNTEYEKQMESALLKAKLAGVTHVIFGDIFLEDLRAYREKNLEKVEMKAVFPIWKLDTRWLIGDFLKKGFRTLTCCINDGYLKEDHVGKEIDQKFIDSLPVDVDPCGENGEFHTFCYEGPIFQKKIKFNLGEKIYRPLEVKTDNICITSSVTKGFWFCDLIPE